MDSVRIANKDRDSALEVAAEYVEDGVRRATRTVFIHGVLLLWAARLVTELEHAKAIRLVGDDREPAIRGGDSPLYRTAAFGGARVVAVRVDPLPQPLAGGAGANHGRCPDISGPSDRTSAEVANAIVAPGPHGTGKALAGFGLDAGVIDQREPARLNEDPPESRP